MKIIISKSILMILLMIGVCLTTTSCSKDDENIMSQFSSLFNRTDFFIDILDTVYEHYDAWGLKAKDTSDGKFTVTPMGRLIVVKKKTLAGSVSYATIKLALSKHYRNNYKVKNVY